MKKFTLILTILISTTLSNCSKEKVDIAKKTDIPSMPVIAESSSTEIAKADVTPVSNVQSDLPKVMDSDVSTASTSNSDGSVIHYKSSRSSNSTFQDLLKSNNYVVVKLGAPWCPPCKAMIKPLEDVAKVYAGKVTFVEVNIDENPEIQSLYADNAKSIPTTMFFHKGKKQHQHTGGLSKTEITKKIKEFFNI